ncbi:uncharacterized protein LACBIDRAFT_321001 [Laccaria bicolor S238N-H82]|uniref:Predicted protein n=1 Tax=Laccaria bicolor (strain S238N-H82 / ATCC MYA-4686) TaxID=486041 RepID=B0CNG5_LACBS|nr:uncharacterized protein LACBIDRAFT_321001 [Laccaria bicolor S238N-H82]EDR15924.1 predicted protein [Laccaria bicolor S238N-H82]|eukprot:XP_001874132.1 predicted protein [Laccaria bicolor S238N-H82]
MTMPELYLSLLSGQEGDVSHLSTEQRHNDVGSRLSGHPFPNDPDRLMDLLDALAAVCVWKERRQVMFVSLSTTMDLKAATLYVSSNETVPATVTSHLHIIQGQLKELQSILFNKRAPDILATYDNFTKSSKLDNQDARLLQATHFALKHIQDLLQSERPPPDLSRLIWTIDRLSMLTGTGKACCNISIQVTEKAVLPIIFPVGEQEQLLVCDDILNRLQEKAKSEGVRMEKRKLSIKQAAVHAECTLLAYHIQHPNIHPYCYFGGSKLSFHGCATFFSSYNLVAESFHLPQFFTKGSHNKIYLRWPCPPLLPLQRSKPLQPGTLSLDTQVRQKMIAALGKELSEYVNELRTVRAGPSQSQSDSTAASSDSRKPAEEGLADLEAGT